MVDAAWSWIITVSVAVAVFVPDCVYVTMIVQVPAGARTVVAVQVPPVIANVPVPVPPLVPSVGAPVNVIGPAVVPVAELLTVMVPVWGVVAAGVGFIAGLGAENAALPSVTWKVLLRVTVPLAVPVTVTVLAVSAAAKVIAQVAVTVVAVGVPVIVQVTPVPLMATPVAPVRFSPVPAVIVTGTVAPRAPEIGEMVAFDAITVNMLLTVMVPLAVPVTVTVLAESGAVVVITQLAWTVVAVVVPVIVQVTPPAGVIVTAVAPVRFAPGPAVIVTGTVLPRSPEVGAMVAPGAVTVKITLPLVPSGVVTLTFLPLVVAVAAMLKVASTVVLLTTPMPVTVMPAPDTLTADVPVRFVPVRVTFTVVPRCPEFGTIEVRVGVRAVLRPAWVSTAP